MTSRQSLTSLPSRAETLAQLELLADGILSREDASGWAETWVLADHTPGTDVQIEDRGVWEALKLMLGADLDGGDRPYLYGGEDFRAWADELRSSAA